MAVLSTWLADGVHAELRWYVQRVEGTDAPLATVIGFIGSTYVTETCELPGQGMIGTSFFDALPGHA